SLTILAISSGKALPVRLAKGTIATGIASREPWVISITSSARAGIVANTPKKTINNHIGLICTILKPFQSIKALSFGVEMQFKHPESFEQASLGNRITVHCRSRAQR